MTIIWFKFDVTILWLYSDTKNIIYESFKQEDNFIVGLKKFSDTDIIGFDNSKNIYSKPFNQCCLMELRANQDLSFTGLSIWYGFQNDGIWTTELRKRLARQRKWELQIAELGC